MSDFLCGCKRDRLLAFGYKSKFENGREVCPDHGFPLYGYRTSEAVDIGILYDARIPREINGTSIPNPSAEDNATIKSDRGTDITNPISNRRQTDSKKSPVRKPAKGNRKANPI